MCNIKCDMEKSYDTMSYVLNNNSPCLSKYRKTKEKNQTISNCCNSCDSKKVHQDLRETDEEEKSWSETVLKLHLMHWNGSLARLTSMRYTKEQVILHIILKTVIHWPNHTLSMISIILNI